MGLVLSDLTDEQRKELERQERRADRGRRRRRARQRAAGRRDPRDHPAAAQPTEAKIAAQVNDAAREARQGRVGHVAAAARRQAVLRDAEARRTASERVSIAGTPVGCSADRRVAVSAVATLTLLVARVLPSVRRDARRARAARRAARRARSSRSTSTPTRRSRRASATSCRCCCWAPADGVELCHYRLDRGPSWRARCGARR